MTDHANDIDDATPSEGTRHLTDLAREIADERARRGHSDVDGAALPPEQQQAVDPSAGSRGYTTDEPADPNVGSSTPPGGHTLTPEEANEVREDPNGALRSGAGPLRPSGSDLSAP